jgi:ketosteroid isomerase-like protein
MRSKVFFVFIPAIVVTLIASDRGTAATAPNATHADSVAVAKVVTDFHAALAKGDSVAALRLLASDAIILESGAVERRPEYRSHHLPADIEFAKTVSAKRGPLQVTVKGTAAWTAATSEAKGEFKGRVIDSTGAESMILTKEAAGWRIRSIHWSSRKRTPTN